MQGTNEVKEAFVESSRRSAKWYVKWGNQTKLLLWKNWRLAWRRRRSQIIQLIVPALLVFSLWLLDRALRSNDFFGNLYDVIRSPSNDEISNIPICTPGIDRDSCYTFLYAPNNSAVVDEIIRTIREDNMPSILSENIRGFLTPDDADKWMYENYNMTQGAILFNISGTDIDYTIQFNNTDLFSHGSIIRQPDRILIPMTYAVQKAIFKYATGGISELNIKLSNFAHPEILTINAIGDNGPSWFFAALMFNFVAGLNLLVQEKEMKLREIMKIMGLYDSVYWFTWLITLFIQATLTVFILIITGCIFQFDFFLKNSFGLYFFLLWMFGLATVGLTFLISTLVKKSNNATTVGFLIFILGYFLQIGGSIIFASSSASQGLKVIFALFCPTMLQVGLSDLGSATQRESSPGLGWDIVSDVNATSNRWVSFQGMFLWLFLDFWIYFLLAIYLDNVISNEYGVSRPFYYFLTPSYWTGKSRPKGKNAKVKSESSVELSEIDEDVRAEAEAIRSKKIPNNAAVVIEGLRKVYKQVTGGKQKCGGCCDCCQSKEAFVAVNDLCLSIEKDTLLCLLGPNGAGKTTSIHMMVGFHEPTSGDATIFGNSIVQNISQVQQMMGVCPQFDILWPELSGEEHLYLFSGLKGLTSTEIPHEIERLLKAVELVDARKVNSVSYSGGMRRRLSVAIALIGSPKIVFLDEPTTGMDPISRRKVWDIIESEKKNKVIVLTTHSMEEADTLSDKIAIMARGRLQCVGSSLHLKQKFGSGYRVTIGAVPGKVDEVQKFVESSIQGAKIQGSVIGGYMNYLVPRSMTADLVPFFRKLESQKDALGIMDLQLGLTTLEEVFLSIAESAELNAIQNRVKNGKEKLGIVDLSDLAVESESSIPSIPSGKKDVESQKPKKKKKSKSEGKAKALKYSNLDQFKALFIKNASLQKRDTKTMICQILTPFALVGLLFGFDRLINNLIDGIPIAETIYPKPFQPTAFFPLPDPGDSAIEGLVHPDYIQRMNTSGASFFFTGPSNINFGSYENGTGLLGNIKPSFGNRMQFKYTEFIAQGRDYRQDFTRPPYFWKLNSEKFESRSEIDERIFSEYSKDPYIFAGFDIEEYDLNNNKFTINVISNSSQTFGLDVPFFMHMIVSAVAGSLNSPFNLTMSGIKTMPLYRDDDGFTLDLASLAGSFFYVLILTQLLPVFISNIVYEKETKTREIMGMMGLNMKIYWIVHYLFDYLLYLAVMFFLIIAGNIFRFRTFTINNFFSYFMLFFLWGHVLIAMSFLLSVFFSKKRIALVFGFFLILAIALVCAVYLDSAIGDVMNTPVSRANWLSIIPPFNLYRGLIYLAAEVSWLGPGYKLNTLGERVVNMGTVYLFCIGQWAVLMLVWWYLEQVVPSSWGVKKHPLFMFGFGKHKNFTDKEEKLDSERLPDDVVAERNRVMQKTPDDEFAIQVQNIRKVYPAADGNPPKIAVKGVSVGIEENSCMGILGHNGAGKTTLIHMLIGLFKASSGTAFIRGFNLEDEIESIHTFMGICPQHDVIWETLTGEEHLLFYGRIKGLKGKELNDRVDYVLKRVNLFESRRKPAGKYSGGMKRRLSVAIAIIAKPKVLYLDEPSTGLDPKSRQDLWSVINEAKENAAVILTTHSMEEADALCDRLMIMAEGEIKCIGVAADLKSRFGEGYKLSLQVAKGCAQEPVEKFVKNFLPGASLLNNLAGTRNYQVPRNEVKLEKVFEQFESHKEKLNITDWAITNTTLEEVFLRISNMSEEKSTKDEKNSDSSSKEKESKSSKSESSEDSD